MSSTKNYTYTYLIDISKEDYRDTRARLKNQDHYYNWYIRINYIYHLFLQYELLKKFLELIFNQNYYTMEGSSENYNPILYIFKITETITKFVIAPKYICYNFGTKKR